MIVRIKFNDDLTMMFGDSYKPWRIQFDEYCWNYKKVLGEIEEISICSDKWISWGGLKWCTGENFQHQLNREGCQSQDENNPNARQYSEMKFAFDSIVARTALRILEDARNGRTDNRLLLKGILPKGT
ncbi:spore protein H [Paenibacillus medicaginis]|uniref:Spore protein H n=1 Tax=Paenibacillus medicaginis TaxID=1470560 RepID=A0ABV5BUH0_9BACL